MSALCAFVFQGSGDWKVSDVDDWAMDVVELDGNEKTMGHRKIDGAICKVLQTQDNKLVAITK